MYKYGHHFTNVGPKGLGFIHLPFIQCYKTKFVIKRYVIPIIWKGDITKKIGFARWKKWEGKKLPDHPYRFDLFLNFSAIKEATTQAVPRFYPLYPVWRSDFPNVSPNAGVISLEDKPLEGEPIKSLDQQLPKVEREQIRRRKLYTANIVKREMLEAAQTLIIKSNEDGRHEISPSNTGGFQPVPVPKSAYSGNVSPNRAAGNNVQPPESGGDVAGGRSGVVPPES